MPTRSAVHVRQDDSVSLAAPIDAAPVLDDLRFRALLGAAAWSRMPEAVRGRFSKRLRPDAAITYAGEIIESRRSWLGGLLAQCCRVIGGPLPLYDDIAVPAVVTVTEDGATGGQFWMRMYGRRNGFPQVVHSSKRFAGPTGLEEYLGFGFGIALRVTADDQALHFTSDHYFLKIMRVRLRVPRWMSPGDLTVSHIDRPSGWFSFVLSLRHGVFGELIHQDGLFRERFADSASGTSHV